MEFTFTPIGFVRGGGRYPQEAPRQACYADNRGVIELEPHRNFETAAAELAGFDRIWVLFVFDRNSHWTPRVRPPLGGMQRKIGVFATRSPYRPNPIGLSAIELTGVRGRKLFIRNFDLLDGTPVLDVKPYIPVADSFPEAATGWRGEVQEPSIQLHFTENARRASSWILSHGGPDLAETARVQLSTREMDTRRQRLQQRAENAWVLAFRTWRIDFEWISPDEILITAIRSGYEEAELHPDAPDPYHDKELHRAYRRLP